VEEREGVAEQASILAWALAVGALGSAPALAFRWAASALPDLVWPGAPDLVQAVARAPAALRIAVPTLGLLLAGLVLVAGERAGAGRGWDILEAVRLRDGVLPLRATLVRAASSLVTVASAGPVGREGAIVLLPAALGSALGRRARLPPRRLRLLVACGAAAGLACAYNTPLGAALFTMEIVFGTFSLEALAPLVVASATGTLLARHLFGPAPVFELPPLVLGSAGEVAAVALLGVLAGLGASAFLGALRAAGALWRRARLPRPASMALAGLAVGAAVLAYPEVVGNGREAIADLFRSPVAPSHALALLGLRLVLTPLAVGAGTVGGVFTPTLFLGAMLGSAFGAGVQALLPSAGADPRAWAVVGMGAFLAGTTHAPLTAVVMVFEMTLDYGVAVPLLVGAALAAVVATRLARASVYTEALSRAGAPPGPAAAGRDRVRDVMAAEHIAVPPDLPLPEVLSRLLAARRNHLYVADDAGRFLGAVSLHDATRIAGEAPDPSAFAAADVMNRRFEATFPDESLERVLDRFGRQSCERLPVLDGPRSRRLLGTASKRDILALYARALVAGPPAGPDGAAPGKA
jgi:CIC family chloride channel protein